MSGTTSSVIPRGCSTCSKAPIYEPEEPRKIVRGSGCRVYSDDGREFIDYRNALGPVTLGYAFPEVNEAVSRQLQDGITFGQPHPLEEEVAVKLTQIIPCAEQVRFLKTGGEALAACIRLARHVTGRQHIIQIGYNGWLNTLAPSAICLPGAESSGKQLPGVPEAISALYHRAYWNDMSFMEKLAEELKDDVAAVVVAADYPGLAEGKSFYPALRAFTEQRGILLVLDEIVTGFRIALGGVQEYFDFVPDLTVVSKGMANGMPISAFLGKAKAMSGLEVLTVSSTFGSEALGLAATKAAIGVYEKESVIEHIWTQGERLWSGLNERFERHGLPIRAKGLWPCPQLTIEGEDKTLRERFFRMAYKQGVSLYSVSYVNFSHKAADIDETLERLEGGMAVL